MANYNPTYNEAERVYDPHTLAEVMDQRAIRVESIEGRTFVYGHKNMADLTKRPIARAHKFLSIDSLIEFVLTKGDKEKSLLFVGDTGIDFVLDGDWMENISTYSLNPSKAKKRWLMSSYDQSDMIDLLDAWQGEIEYFGNPGVKDIGEMLMKLHKLELAQDIAYDSKYDDDNNIKVSFTAQEKGGGVSLPKQWGLKIPLFEGSEPCVIDCKLQYTIPKVKGDEPVFKLKCAKLEAYTEQAIEQIHTFLRDQLPGFLILRGTK